MTALDRNDIITGLRELIAELRAAEQVAGIRLVGGAALALHYFDRGTTQDLDSLHVHPGHDEAVAAAAMKVAQRHGWDPAWLNFQVASKEALLAMKLRANRPGRDTRDIRLLLGLCQMTRLEEVEDFYEEFYPADGLTSRAISMVTAILADGPIPVPEPPEQIAL